MRKSPFWSATERYGCRSYDVYNRMYSPREFADPLEDYWHQVNHVTVWDVSAERCIEIAGRDAHRFMNMLTPRDLSRCAVGQAKYCMLTDERGGIVNDPVLLRLQEQRYWLRSADSDVLLWMKGVAINASLDIELHEAEAWPLHVQGPRASDVLQALDPETEPDGWMIETRVRGIPVLLVRAGNSWSKPAWSGGAFYLYLLDASRGDELWEGVMDAGRPFDIRPTGPSDRMRIEEGIFEYGADVSLEKQSLRGHGTRGARGGAGR